MKGKLLLGVFHRIIPPPVGCCLAGYAPDVIAEKVNDDGAPRAPHSLRGGKGKYEQFSPRPSTCAAAPSAITVR